MSRRLILAVTVGATIAMAHAVQAQDAAVPVEREPTHRTVLKNAWLQVFRVKLLPGRTSLMHIHAHDDVAVRLDSSVSINQPQGQPEAPPSKTVPGMVSARTNEPNPTIHRVRNVGTTLFDVLDVQALTRPDGAQAPAIVAPAVENPRMRVYRYELEPGARIAEHTHTRPYLLVAATPIRLETAPAHGVARTVALKTGEFRWVTGPATHTLRNGGAAKGIVVEIELK